MIIVHVQHLKWNFGIISTSSYFHLSNLGAKTLHIELISHAKFGDRQTILVIMRSVLVDWKIVGL